MRFSSLCFVAMIVLASCSSHPKKTPHGNQMAAIYSSYWEEHNKYFPLDATQQGDNRYNNVLLDDQNESFRATLKAYYQRYQKQALAVNRESLSEDERITYDTFLYDMQSAIEGFDDDTWMIPFQQFWGLPLTMGQLGSGEQFQPFKTVQDYENWLSRVKGFLFWSLSARENFRRGMEKGFVLPRVLVKKIIPQMKELVVADPTQSLFYGPIKKMPESFSAADKQRLTKLYAESIQNELVPTFKMWQKFFEQEYLPKARRSSGINALKGGKEIYRRLVKYWTTTDMRPEEIQKIGYAEVKRIRGEMEKVKAQVGFKGPLRQFFIHLRNDPKLMPYQTPEDVLNAFRAIHARIEAQLPKMFGRAPKTPFEIRQTEKFREASASAEYNQGSPDGTRPGIFYIPIIDAKKFNVTSGMESLFLHEAIPGHHYQISLQQENTALPQFRRFSWYGAMGEGWALYTESLGKELGLYTDPYQYMGSLGDEMHRAVRLVVDVGLHTGQMSREAAIKYMLANEPIPEKDAVAEVERYMAIPGQALSYKVGALKIRELRQRYEQLLGARFKLADFHDELLKDGVLPLAVLERKMDAWARALVEKQPTK